jgi:HEAT repeat protein
MASMKCNKKGAEALEVAVRQLKTRGRWSDKKWRSLGSAALVMMILLTAGCMQDPQEKIDRIYSAKAEPSEENLTRIRAYLEDPDRDVRATAINALVTLDVPDAAALARRALDDPDGFVRSRGAILLGAVGSEEDVPLLVSHLLNDLDPIVRQNAASSLAQLGGQEATLGLIKGLSDPMEEVRLAAVRGVRSLEPGLATAELSRLLLEDTVWEIRVQAARALGATGDPSVLPVLENALGDANEFVRAAASHAMEVHRALSADDRDAAARLESSAGDGEW